MSIRVRRASKWECRFIDSVVSKGHRDLCIIFVVVRALGIFISAAGRQCTVDNGNRYRYYYYWKLSIGSECVQRINCLHPIIVVIIVFILECDRCSRWTDDDDDRSDIDGCRLLTVLSQFVHVHGTYFMAIFASNYQRKDNSSSLIFSAIDFYRHTFFRVSNERRCTIFISVSRSIIMFGLNGE